MANKWVRLACQRHLTDLKTAKRRGLHFDEAAADHIMAFFEEFLVLYEGEWDGQPFILQLWEKFIVGSLFGWKAKGDVRRFRTAYLEIAKGNGKTPLASGVGLYGLVFDGEAGCEIYSAATTREQAGILFRDARAFADGSPELKEILTIERHNIAHVPSNSFFRPVSSEHRGLDGKRPHIALIDEIHEHPDAMVVDKIRAGTKGRRQALIVEITNSGVDRHSICYQHHEYTQKILEGTLENDSWFGFITGLDVCEKCEAEGKTIPQEGCPKCDDWRDEKVFPKANPNLGVSIKLKYLQEQVAEAMAMPHKENIVKRLNFNIWTDTVTRWIPAEKWAACADPALDLTNFATQPCYAAIDLATKRDICARILVFALPEEDGQPCVAIFGRYYLPEETIRESKRAEYRTWVKEDRIVQTPGAMTDFRYIEDDLKATHAQHPIRELAFDPREATYLVNNVMAWLGEDRCIEITQGPQHMSEPMKQLEAMIYARRVRHDGDPVLAWMMSNVVKKTARSGDPVKYYYPTKGSEDQKIDGVVALIMALGRAMLKEAPEDSVYEGLTVEEIRERMAL